MSGKTADTGSSRQADRAQPARHGTHGTAQPQSVPGGGAAATTVAVLLVAAAALVAGAFFAEPLRKAPSAVFAALGADGAGQRAAETATTRTGGDTSYYSCGMHPWVILPDPGICPVCRMDLTPIDPGKFTGEITIDPVVVQNIGVRIEPVEEGPLVQTIRTVGNVDYDETRVRDVNIKVEGWIEKLHVDFVGEEVEAGEPLFDLYSPKLFEAQEEYLLEYRRQRTGDVPLGGTDLLEAARTRLEYFDITPAQIRALEERDRPAKTMTIHSPHAGIVMDKHANEGMKVDPGMRVYRIADLSKIWVLVSIYESQLPYLKLGQKAVMTLPYIPGQTFEGRVIYIYPYVDVKTRQANVRLEFENPELLLKPGMYANVSLQSRLAEERTLVPRPAVIDTGLRQIAFVSLGAGRFEPRELRVGVETLDGKVEVIEGLKPGEMVVTSGQFLLDSEAKIREALAKMMTGTLAAEQEAAVATEGASELDELPPAAASALNDVLSAYFAIGTTLADDTTEDLERHAREIASGIDGLLAVEIPGKPRFWHEHDAAATVRGEALRLIEADGLEAARLRFADLSVALESILRATGVPPSHGAEVHSLHCPMYLEGQGGSTWLQPAGSPRNPFYGSRMLECFDERVAMPVTGAGPPAASDEIEEEPEPPAPTAGAPQEVVPLPDEVRAQIAALLGAYYRMHDALAGDEAEAAREALPALHDAAAVLAEADAAAVAEPATRVEQAARQRPEDLETLRATFETASGAIAELLAAAPPDEAVYRLYCPMVKKSWLQATDEVANPYAPYMPRCGRVEETFADRPREDADP